jgi:hypothetical protein
MSHVLYSDDHLLKVTRDRERQRILRIIIICHYLNFFLLGLFVTAISRKGNCEGHGSSTIHSVDDRLTIKNLPYFLVLLFTLSLLYYFTHSINSMPDRSRMERSPSWVASDFSIAEETKEEREAEDGDLTGLSKEDSRKICIQKSIFVAVLVAVAITVTTLVNISATSEERSRFETEFDDLASKLTENFITVFETKVLTGQTIATTFSSDADYYNLTWPNVLQPDFSRRMLGHRLVAESGTILFAPLVTDATRSLWEDYVVANADQVPLKPSNEPGCEETGECRTLADGIYTVDPEDGAIVPDSGPGPYFPYFQVATDDDGVAVHVLTNYYTVPNIKAVYDLLLVKKAPVISELQEGVAKSILLSPIFDTLESAVREVVGCIQLAVDWISFFERTVTPTEGSVTAVLTTGKGEVMSFDISDEDVTFIGAGDRHDNDYNKYEECTDVESDESSRNYVAVLMPPITDAGSRTFSYGLCVYPTKSFEDAYLTRLPAVYTTVAAFVFVFVLIMFFIYDKLVERRQELTAGQAQRFGRVVHSLFPPAFRGRILTKEETRPSTPEQRDRPSMKGKWSSFKRRLSNDGTTSRVVEPAKTRLRTFLSDNEKRDFAEMEEYKYDEPIADLFPETTIMFADISGFTAWSSEREPSQVFYLLETLYRAFDQLASRLGVFKVETIGDCYVAVTGLPDPNEVSGFCKDLDSHIDTLSHFSCVLIGSCGGNGSLCVRVYSRNKQASQVT